MTPEQVITPFVFCYNNPKLAERCIDFSYYGSVLLKKLFKQNEMKCKVQVKKYIICDEPDDGVYSPYHFYIEIKTPTKKLIIDNCDSYNYWFYMAKFKPRGTIKIVSQREINEQVKLKNIDENIEEIIKNTILYHFENIKCDLSI